MRDIMMRAAPQLIAIVAVLAVVASACGDAGERVTDGAVEQVSDDGRAADDIGEGGEGSVTDETDEGPSAQFDDVDSLPDSFPDDVPLPSADYQITQTLEDSTSAGPSVHATLSVQASAADVIEELEAAFAANGWENESSQDMGGDGFTNLVMSFSKGDMQVLLMIMSNDGGETTVSYTAGDA